MRPGVAFHVHGVPAPKGSRTAGQRKDGTIYTRPASKRERPWVETVARTALILQPIDPPYLVTLDFYFPKPKSSRYRYPVRDDLDKLVRATLDGLVQGQLLLDDRHVIDLAATKAYGEPGCAVTVLPC